jgi:Uma2 family endonuclease
MIALQKEDNYELFSRSKESSLPSKTYRKSKIRLVYNAPKQMSESDNDYDETIESDHDETLAGKAVTEEEYWDKYYTDTPYEWNNGILEVKPLSDYRANLLQIFFEDLIREYRNLGINFQQIKCEIGFRMMLNKGKKIRKPDIGFVGPDSLQMEELDCSYKGIFDLCVEFLSDSKPSEVKRDIKQKYEEYEEAGVKEYFILDRNETHTAFYRLNNGRYAPINISDGVVRSEVLKQFQFRVQHLYLRPDLKELIDDPVYNHYVKIDLQKEKKRADRTERLVVQEKVRAEQERARAEQEKARAEEYRKKLIALGISI